MNSSSQLSTHSNQGPLDNLKRLYVITGKGGVGKTSIALALTKYLKDNGKKVIYNSFDHEPNYALLTDLGLPYVHHSTDESAKTYVANKLGSEMIASWVMKTPFFSSLFNMLPGLSHMILLGHLIKELEENEDLVMILDSPSSGHALSMYESSHNFHEMFGSGLIVDDINRMHRFIYDQQNIKTIICSLPTEMALQEAAELKDYLKKLKVGDIDLVLNDSIHLYLKELGVSEEEIPEFIDVKSKQESEVIESNIKNDLKLAIAHSVATDKTKVIEELSSKVGEIL